MAEKIHFEWDPEANSTSYQLFEDGVLAVDNIVTPNFDLLMADIAQGPHEYQVRGVNEFGEGPLSNPLTINYVLPGKVLNLRYTLV